MKCVKVQPNFSCVHVKLPSPLCAMRGLDRLALAADAAGEAEAEQQLFQWVEHEPILSVGLSFSRLPCRISFVLPVCKALRHVFFNCFVVSLRHVGDLELKVRPKIFRSMGKLEYRLTKSCPWTISKPESVVKKLHFNFIVDRFLSF